MLRNLLSFRTAGESLVIGAFVDFAAALILVLLISTQIYLPLPLKIAVALVLALVLYVWSTGFFTNKVDLFHMGIVTFFGRAVPSGPEGKGLLPGYPYWLPLGFPLCWIAFSKSVKELSVPFENLQVWTKNAEEKGKGSIQGVLDGLAQFAIVDVAQYESVENPFKVLEGITHESARDAAEDMTAEAYLDTENKELGDDIYEDIIDKLNKRTRDLGVRCVSVSVKKTDNLDPKVKDAWAQVSAQRSLATSRKIDADARAERIKTYKDAGVDANRAVAVDLVADDKSGATVDDRRFNADVGESLKNLGSDLINWLGRK